ncbi:uncharacterized protein LOC129962526 [Argiope bruennichi]|uniref:uncharacterized protein LOC129962526 n=1 Tax=Argiope bruennichi TaxID=94029 RepID=UPI002493D9BD|nr:uncharacterized protein LOC129962526 [Argiope bruennichi]
MESSLSIVASSTEIEIKAEKQTNANGKAVVTLEKLLEQYGDNGVKTFANGELHDPDRQTFIVDASRLLASVYDNLRGGFSEDELERYTDMVSTISHKYKDNPELVHQISNWRKSRKELIEISMSAANQLDKFIFVVNISRIIGSITEILNSLNLDIYQKCCSGITFYIYSISPRLGLIIEGALELAPHLRFMGFVSSLFEIMRSQVVINHVVKAMKKDKEMFQPLKEWFDETDEFEDSVKRLFPHGIDKEIIEGIEGALKDLGKEETIFAATILSNIKKDPMIFKDGKFLAKVFLFCRSDAAKQWYKRMVAGACPSELECDMLYFRTELQQLEGTDVDSGSKLEIGKCSVEQMENTVKNNSKSLLGRFILCCMSGMSIYYCYENIRAGSKHRYSDRLRELSTNAQLFYQKMEKIRLSEME